MKKVKLYRIIMIVNIFLWAFIIFQMSNQVGEDSSNLSRIVTKFFVRKEEYVDIVEPYIRKLAHFSEYGFGGCLIVALLNSYEWKDKSKIIIAILLGIWYAILDETHQVMVIARNGSVKDVILDSIGVATGVVGMMTLFKIYNILLQNRNNKKVSVK